MTPTRLPPPGIAFKSGTPTSRRAPAVRAPWEHMRVRLEDAQFIPRLRKNILHIADYQDEVVFGMLSRYVRAARTRDATTLSSLRVRTARTLRR